METRASEEAAPIGVIACTRIGFELVSRNLWLVLFPIALDLLLWLGPHLSVSPLLQTLANVLRAQFGSDPALVSQLRQLGDLIDQLGQHYNLVSLLSGLPLFTVPSLLAGHAPGTLSPLGGAHVHLTTNLLSLFVWGAGLLLAGLAIGVVFLSLLARQVSKAGLSAQPARVPAATEEQVPRRRDWTQGVRLVRALLFVGAILLLAACILPVWALLFGMAVMIAPLAGVVMWVVSIGIASYVGLHLLFVVHGVLLGGRRLVRAIWESVVMIHSQLPSVAGLVVLIVVVYQGMGQVWSLPSGDSWLLLVGILGNACIATGLTAATFIFYEQRIPRVLEAAKRRRLTTRA